jgi:hypothetical protein
MRNTWAIYSRLLTSRFDPRIYKYDTEALWFKLVSLEVGFNYEIRNELNQSFIFWQGNGPIRHVETCPDFFSPTARAHTTKSTVKILAANTHCKYFLKIAEITRFSCTRNRLYSRDVTALCDALCWGWTFLQRSGRLQYWQRSVI